MVPDMRPVLLLVLLAAVAAAYEPQQKEVITGKAAFADYTQQKPGVRRKIRLADLPEPNPQEAVENHPQMAPRPEGAWPKAPAGFKVTLYSKDVERPRLLRTAPNGDIFVAESYTGKIKVFRGVDTDGKAKEMSEFAVNQQRPWGIAFYPPGPDPQYVYIGNTGAVVRFPYKNGDLKASGPAETIVPDLPTGFRTGGGGHWTRTIVFGA